MSGSTEQPPVDERQRRALADTAVAMRWAGNELTGHAGQVVARVFEHLGVSDAQDPICQRSCHPKNGLRGDQRSLG